MAVPAQNPGAGDEQGHIEEVRIEDLHTDSYQRSISLTKVENLLANWNEKAVGYALISRRANGDLYVVDGQHRAAALLQRGEKTIKGHIYTGMTVKQEAQLRIDTNRRKGDLIWERFKARIVAEDSVALGIREAIESVGGDIRLTSFSGRDSFVALAAAERLYLFDGDGEILRRVLRIVVAAFGKPTSETAPSTVLNAVGHMVVAHPDLDDDRLAERLNGIGIVLMNQRALHFRGIYTGSKVVNWYRAAVEAYNYKLGKARRLDYKSPPRSRPVVWPDPSEAVDETEEGQEDEQNGDDSGSD
jgi:hypothetical protein